MAAPDFDFWRQVVAWGAFATFLVTFLGLLATTKYLSFEEDQRRHYRAVKEALMDASATSLAIHTSESVSEYREEVYGLLRGENPGQQTLRGAFGELKSAVAAQTPAIPLLALRGLYEGLLILVFGGIALLPTAWWESASTVGAGGIQISALFGVVGDLLDQVLGATPYGDVVVGLVTATVVIVGGTLYQHGIQLGFILLAGSVILAVIDRMTAENLNVRLYDDHREVAKTAVAVVSVIWLLSVVPVAMFAVAGFEAVGAVIGAVCGGSYALYCLAFYARDASQRINRRSSSQNPRLVAVYIALRKEFALIAVVSLPLVAAYAFVALSTGKAVTVAGILLTANTQVQLALLGAGIVVALAIKAQYPNAYKDLRMAFYRALSSRAVRAWVFARGMPFITVALASLLSWPFVGSLWCIVVGVIAGVIVRSMTWIWTKTKYRFIELKDRDIPVVETVIDGFAIEDADGDPIYIARVDSYGLAHRDKGCLVEATLATAHRRLRESEFAPSFCHYYYEEVTERGIVDMEQVDKQLRGDAETRIEASLANADGNELEIETVDEELGEEYPESHYEQAINKLRERGTISRRQDKYVYHG
jgi:hypothetical protein